MNELIGRLFGDQICTNLNRTLGRMPEAVTERNWMHALDKMEEHRHGLPVTVRVLQHPILTGAER